MARIQAQADERGIGACEKRVDLLRRLDEARAVMVKHGAESGLVADRARDAIDAAGCRIPLRVREAQAWVDTARRAGALGIGRRLVGQDDDGRRFGGDSGKQPRGRYGALEALVVRPRIDQSSRDERADHVEAAAAELVAERRGVRGHEPPIAQLGADIAGLRDLVEHLRVLGTRGLVFEFQHAP